MANIPIFAVAKYESIQPAINSGVLTYPSYILCRDEWTWAFVDKDSTIRRIRGYQQESIIYVDTLPTENIRTDAFYFCNSSVYLYVNNTFVPVFKNSDEDVTSYDQLVDVPMINKYGTVVSPIVVSDLDDGMYSITGQYRLGGNIETIFVTTANVLFLIDSDDNNKYITILDPKKICSYTLDKNTNEFTIHNYATESWVLKQGYATEAFVTNAITELYNKIASEILITKVSQLENDKGYLTSEDILNTNDEDIENLF